MRRIDKNNQEYNIVSPNICWNLSGGYIGKKISGRGRHKCGRGSLGSCRGYGVKRNFNSSNNVNKRGALKSYPYRTVTDIQTEMFTKVKELLV